MRRRAATIAIAIKASKRSARVREIDADQQHAHRQHHKCDVQKQLLRSPENEHQRSHADQQLAKVIRIVDQSQPSESCKTSLSDRFSLPSR